jgi:hypothetical protein
MIRSAHADLKKLYPWYVLEAKVIALPTAGFLDFRPYYIQGPKRRILLVSSDWVTGQSEARQKYFAAQSLMLGVFREQNTFPSTTSGEIALRGMAASLTDGLGYSGDVRDLLLFEELSEEQLASSFDGTRKRLTEVGAQPIQRTFPDFLVGASREKSLYLGYQFAGLLLQTVAPKEVMKINVVEQFAPRLGSFLNDASIKPVPLADIGS